MILILIEAAVRALLVALVVGVGLRLLRVSNVPAKKAAWGLVLACAVAMPIVMRWQILPQGLTLRLPATALRDAPVSVVTPMSSNSTTLTNATAPSGHGHFKGEVSLHPGAGNRYPAPVVTQGRGNSDSSYEPADAAAETPLATAAMPIPIAARRLPRVASLATLVYAAVCLALLMRMVYGLTLALRLWGSAEPFVPRPFSSGDDDPTLELNVRFSRAVASPVTIGSGVLLPAECLQWDEEKLRIVLAHERAHVRQGDFYLQLAAGIYAAAFWFSPLGWWLKRTLCDLSEAISDHAGLEEAANRTSYAQVLLEFAALPRPTAIGVAMARSSNLSNRIERLLNESSFRQAFAGTRRRVVVAVLLIPVALFAGTALIRVEAAQATQAVPAAPAPTAVPAAEPIAPEPSSNALPAPPVVPATAPAVSAGPYGEVHDSADDRNQAADYANAQKLYAQAKLSADMYKQQAKSYTTAQSTGHGYSYSYSSHGDSYALVTDPGQKISFSGDWNDETHANIDAARKVANGKFLWFTHDGKSYVVDDPAILTQLETMYKPIEDLGAKQEALGKMQEALGRQQEELGRKQEQASIPAPDISKEMADLNAAVAKLNEERGSTITQDQLADLQGKIGEIQGRIGEMQGKIGDKQGELGEEQGKLGEEQGKLGEQQGALGEEQGKLAEQADGQIKSIIDETLHNGKARPVQ